VLAATATSSWPCKAPGACELLERGIEILKSATALLTRLHLSCWRCFCDDVNAEKLCHAGAILSAAQCAARASRIAGECLGTLEDIYMWKGRNHAVREEEEEEEEEEDAAAGLEVRARAGECKGCSKG
jgi:hypothetical protein